VSYTLGLATLPYAGASHRQGRERCAFRNHPWHGRGQDSDLSGVHSAIISSVKSGAKIRLVHPSMLVAVLLLPITMLPPFLALDNRIGFTFASLSIGDEDGSDSTVSGSLTRIKNLAHLLAEDESEQNTHVHIEGHVGISAPAEIAFSYSETRAVVVAESLVAHGVSPCRISIAGWGT
jgi:outer membrane protein OmpA-like peptidoglycan-associated protein